MHGLIGVVIKRVSFRQGVGQFNQLRVMIVGTKGVSQVYHLSFDDNKVLKIINWIC